MNKKSDRKTVSIEFPKNADDEFFAATFYTKVQSKIQAAAGIDLSIDYSICNWINPFSLMAMLCDLELWAFENPDGRVTHNLGSINPGENGRVSVLFMSKLGFLNALANTGNAPAGENTKGPDIQFLYKRTDKTAPDKYSKETIRVLMEHISTDCRTCKTNLNYPDVEVCAPIVFAPRISSKDELRSTTEDAQAFVKRLIVSIDDNYFQGRSSDIRFRDVTLQRIRLAMTELVINSIEHGYGDEYAGPRPVCIFARTLYGSSKRPESTYITTDETNQYIQLFVADVGRGLISDREIWLNNFSGASEEEKVAIKNGIDSLFHLPVSRRNRSESGRGSVTGLQHINFVLGHYQEKVVVGVHGYWAIFQHGSLHKPKKKPARTSDMFPRGTYFDVGIRFALPPELDDSWFVPDRNRLVTVEIRKEVLGSKKSLLKEWCVVELENKLSPTTTIDQLFLSEWFATTTESSTPDQLIVKGTRDLQKSALLKIIEFWLIALAKNAKHNHDYTITIADLSSSQALFLRTLLTGTRAHVNVIGKDERTHRVYEEVLRIPYPLQGIVEVSFQNKPNKLTLLLISEQSEACAIQIELELSRDLLGAKSEFTRFTFRDFRPGPETYAEMLGNSLGALVRHDGKIFGEWLRVSKGVEQRRVVWERERKNVNDSDSLPTLILPVYINYPIVSQDRTISKLIRKALRRAISLFPELRAFPVDELIESDFADATLRLVNFSDSRRLENPHKLFVISCIVSQETINRQRRQLGMAGATLACFTVPSYSITDKRYIDSKELGDNIYSLFDLTVENLAQVKEQFTCGQQYWERIPITPYIRPFIAKDTFGRGKAVVERSSDHWGGAKSRTSSYEEWSSPRVMKLGHWGIDHRHGLIELNYDVCLGRQAEEYSSFYSWLSDEVLKSFAEQRANRPAEEKLLVIYPVSRRNGMIVRHLKKMRQLASHLSSIYFVPLCFLPDIGDGLKLLTPLSSEQIKAACEECLPGVIFLDIGFVGNRTFRHTSRQVRKLGYKWVQGIGLLNRTSYPGLNSEALDITNKDGVKDGVRCYWRLEVPTLDDARSCPICRSLSDLRTLSQYIGNTRTALTARLQEIFSEWGLRRTSTSWQEHGITPAPLVLICDEKYKVALEEFHDQWKVTVENSAQAAAFAVETARITAEQDYPLRYAGALAQCGQQRIALEVLLAYLTLCGHDISRYYVERFGKAILELLFGLSAARPGSSPSDESVLRSLAVIVICGLDADVKTSLQSAFLKHTASNSLSAPELLLIGYVLRMADEANYSSLVEHHLHNPDPAKSENVRLNDSLMWNAKSPSNRHLSRSRSFFGAGDDHGALKGWLDRVETATDAKLLCELTATYIWRDPRELNPVFEVLFEEKSRTLRRVRDLATSDPSDAEKFPLRNDFSSDVIKALSTLRNEFQACYFRIEEKTASFQSIMNIILSTIVRTRGITRDQVRFDRLSFMRKDRRAAAFRYVLVGNQVQEAIISIARSAQRKGQSDQRSHLIRVRLRDEFEDGNAHMPKASIGIEFSNLPSKYASADAFLAMRPLLSEYYQVTELATELSVPSVQRYINEFDEYVVSLRLRLYQGGD